MEAAASLPAKTAEVEQPGSATTITAMTASQPRTRAPQRPERQPTPCCCNHISSTATTQRLFALVRVRPSLGRARSVSRYSGRNS